MLMFRKK